jgi:hypothetical protein
MPDPSLRPVSVSRRTRGFAQDEKLTRTRYERTRPDVNRYLKWAFAEAANSVAVNHARCPDRHVSQLYFRLRLRKGHRRAVGAVARHLAKAAFHVLSRHQTCRDPTLGRTREV